MGEIEFDFFLLKGERELDSFLARGEREIDLFLTKGEREFDSFLSRGGRSWILSSQGGESWLGSFYNLYSNCSLSFTERTARLRLAWISLLEKQRRTETVIPWVEVERQENTW